MRACQKYVTTATRVAESNCRRVSVHEREGKRNFKRQVKSQIKFTEDLPYDGRPYIPVHRVIRG